MSRQQQLFDNLSDEFTRQDVLDQAAELGYSYSAANSMTAKFVYSGKAYRIDHGKYRKSPKV